MRRNKIISLAIAVFIVPLLLAFYSCNETTTPTPPEDEGMTGFPNANGSEWIYSYQGGDLIRYVISGTFNHPSAGDCQQFFVYVWASKGEEDWVQFELYYLKYANNEVRLYLDDVGTDYYLLYKFPLETGDTWNFEPGTTATVGDKTTITVPAGAFEVYQIDYNGDYSFTVWYSGNIGCWGIQNYSWWYLGDDPITTELSSYNIPG